jgi:hypothetical protein
MTTILGGAFKNTPVAYPGSAGDVVVNRFEFSIPASNPIVLADIFEFASLPPYCRIVDGYLDVPGPLGATATFNIGVLTGNAGDTADGSRVITNQELFVAVAGATAAPGAITRLAATQLSAFRLAPDSKERGIGLIFTARTVAVSASIALTLMVATT